MKITLEEIKSAILGLAVADALGVPAEFKSRGTMALKPVTGMTGFGTHNVPAGSWSDDTSMLLCALDSMAKGSINYEEIMQNFYKWIAKGEYTPGGKTFDFGTICARAIDSYHNMNTPPLECGLTYENSNGNGSVMRIQPFSLYVLFTDMTLDEKIKVIHNGSALTHAHPCSLIGCGIYSFILWELLENKSIDSIRAGLEKAKSYYADHADLTRYARIFDPNFANLPEDEIISSGYIVYTLETALWCLLNTDNYRDCVLKAVNLGSDTDTTAAVAGSLAAVLYGIDFIPADWLNTLLRRDYIEDMCERAYNCWAKMRK